MGKFLSTPSARRATVSSGMTRWPRRFLSTPSARRATLASHSSGRCFAFLSTPSARRATARESAHTDRNGNFYPRPPRGGRPSCASTKYWPLQFLSTPSARRATFIRRLAGACVKNFYPRPPRGGRRCYQGSLGNVRKISIHALREEGDLESVMLEQTDIDFYPRPPRGGRPGRSVHISQR